MKINLMSHLLLSVFLFSSALFASVQQEEQVKANQVKINVLPPKWIIEAGNEPLLQREAKLAPAEQSLALILRPLLNKKDYKGALLAIKQAYMPDAKPQPLIDSSPALLQIKGQIYLFLGQDIKAEQAFLKALEILPDFIRAHKSLAVIYIKQKKYQLAQKHIVKTISLGEADAQLYGNLAYINLQLNSPWSAISGYQQAMLLDPNNEQWQQGLLYSLISAKNNPAAKSLLDEMLQHSPNDISLWLQRGRISLNTNEHLDALTSMEMALRLGDRDIDNQISTAQLHLRYGSINRAADLISQVMTHWDTKAFDSKQGINQFNAIESTISWLVHEKHWLEAKMLLKQTTKYATKLSNMQQSKLIQHKARLPGKSKKQITILFEAAIKLDPSNGHGLIALAKHYQEINNLTQAQLLYVRAASLNGFAESAYIGHAQIYIELKNYAGAAKLLRKALKLDPTRQDLVQNIKILDRMNMSQI